jgi:hypothetical protein
MVGGIAYESLTRNLADQDDNDVLGVVHLLGDVVTVVPPFLHLFRVPNHCKHLAAVWKRHLMWSESIALGV